MSHEEIVPVDPTEVFIDIDPIFPEDSQQLTRSATFREQYVWEPCDIEKLPETFASGIQRFLRVANLVESEEPRIAYICRFNTFELAHRLDPTSTGRGVRQFKNSLLRRLEKDNELTARLIDKGDDFKELKRVYDAYLEYVIRNGAAFNLDNSQREKLINARRIASVLYEVLKANDTTGAYAAAPESILLNRDEETGELLVEKADLIVEKCKALEEERQIHMSQGDDLNHLTQTDISAIHKEEVQIKEDRKFANGSMGDGVRSSSAVPYLSNEDKYLETQEKLNKVEKKIEEIELKLKDVDFWTSMMQNMFPDQVPPSMRANQTENNNKQSQ
ncbi:PREDICTED: putative callose synthase 8 [Camelina sativa]|uniref:Callose synthase 8 n=1 Tax=Camelina sativa TaxID=90675 RepID=A0ABM0YJU6_CAMSA|nr:PREDICTED: putative callose synthase 8 [Camelina sativa]